MTKPREIKLKDCTSKTTPESFFGQYSIVVGIHINADYASCSFAFENNPFKIIDINSWDEADILKEDVPTENVKQHQLYPVTVGCNTDSDDIICGPDIFTLRHPCESKYNVHELISEHLENCNESQEGPNNLHAVEVISAFFSDLLEKADRIFKQIIKGEKRQYRARLSFEVKKEYRQKIEEKFLYSRELCRYCISGPSDQRYQALLRKIFVKSGIISLNDSQERLLFVSNAESLGRYLNSTANHSKVFLDGSKYLICDISYDLVNFSMVHVDATESRSNVQAFNITNVPEIQGWRPLERLYHRYLKANNFTEQQLEKELVKFRDDVRAGTFEFVEGSSKAVLDQFLEPITTTLTSFLDKDEKVNMIYCFGDLTVHPHVNDHIESLSAALRRPIIANILDMTGKFFSKGAVMHALAFKDVKLPAIVENVGYIENKLNEKFQDGPVSSNGYDLIIGIDFGTSYSGVSFAKPGSDEIHTIEDWPAGGKFPKVPTLLLYNARTRKLEKEWGDRARISKTKEHHILIQNFKQLLSPSLTKRFYGRGSTGFRSAENTEGSLGIDISTMVEHFFRSLMATALSKIKNTIVLQKLVRTKCILTVPISWNEEAKSTMLGAALKAGLAKNKDDITLITEPEAVTLCFDEFIERLNPNGSHFIVCDAGGFTVDLLTMATAMENTQQSVRQVGGGCGDNCGSNHINHRFGIYLTECFPHDFFRKPEFLDYILEKFEYIKRGFDGSEKTIAIPLPKFMKNVKSFQEKKSKCIVKNGVIYMPGRNIKDIFDEVIERTIFLLELEYKKSTNTRSLETVLLVGGFSHSRYLQREIKAWCDSKAIRLITPNRNSLTAVSYGAVSYGLNPRLVTRRTTNRSFALLLEPSPGFKVLDYFVWKGAEVNTVNGYTKRILLDGRSSIVVEIFRDDGTANNGQMNADEFILFSNAFTKIIELRVDKRRYQKYVDVKLQFTAVGVECYIYHDGITEDFEYTSVIDQKANSYKLKYPGLGADAMKVLDSLKYRPLHM